jgi:putative nucleotidyltransferase with HDIG domain
MRLMPWKSKKKGVSRNERVEKFSRHLRFTGGRSKEIIPRLGLAAAFIVTVTVLFPPSRRAQEAIFKAGQISDRNIIAPFDFEVPLSDEDLKIARASAALKVLPIYVRDVTVEQSLVGDLAEVFDSLKVIANDDTITRDQKIDMAASLLPYLSSDVLSQVVDRMRLAVMRHAALDFQQRVFKAGFIDNSSPIRRQSHSEISVIGDGGETRVPVRDVIDQGRIDQVIRETGFSLFQKDRESARLFVEIVRAHLLPNLIFDAEETERRRQSAMEQVSAAVHVSKNERVIGKHDKVTAEQERMLIALERATDSEKDGKSLVMVLTLYAAEILRLAIFALLFGGYMFVFHREVYNDILKLTAICTVLVIYMGFATVVFRFSLSPYLIPVAFVSLMTTALFDYRVGLVAAVFASLVVPLVADLSAHVAFVSLFAGAAAAVGLLKMRSRTHFHSVFLAVAGAYLVGALAAEVGHATELEALYESALWGVGNGLFSTLTAMFLLPIFEGVFNVTTRFTLLELTDLNKPVLKRLNMEAPGTYHHSMLLGSLVDSVAGDVGADPLKARVMAYYHDIGKIFKPEYYAENQEAGFNKHEKITAQMSSLILLSHVKDGVELAREEKLPDLISDAILQHHGTTVMAFFYQKALETDSHSSVNKDDFRYPGPKPQTKEAAILMLADTVEPACRSLRDPTTAQIRNMVGKLINARAQDGELDASGLTLNDLAKIREKFVTLLTGIYHKRLAYPGQEEEDRPSEAVAKPV